MSKQEQFAFRQNGEKAFLVYPSHGQGDMTIQLTNNICYKMKLHYSIFLLMSERDLRLTTLPC